MRQVKGSLASAESILEHMQSVEDGYVERLKEMGFHCDEDMLRLAVSLSNNDLDSAVSTLQLEEEDQNEVRICDA